MGTNKTSSEAFSLYRRWMKEFLKADIKLPKDSSKAMLWAYCSAMAEHGTNGISCFASDQRIAGELKLKRDTVTKYRHLALELGWLVPTGKRHGRAEGLSIAIPDPDAYRPSVAVSEPRTDNPAVNEERPSSPRLTRSESCSRPSNILLTLLAVIRTSRSD